MKTKAICVTLNTNLLTRIDEYVQERGIGSNRSALLTAAAEMYLMEKKGFHNIRRKKQLENEL